MCVYGHVQYKDIYTCVIYNSTRLENSITKKRNRKLAFFSMSGVDGHGRVLVKTKVHIPYNSPTQVYNPMALIYSELCGHHNQLQNILSPQKRNLVPL